MPRPKLDIRSALLSDSAGRQVKLDKGGQNAGNNAKNGVEDCLDVHQQSANDSVQRGHEAAENDEQRL